jgi:uncharacterized RDD family membrane protein YckC
MQRKIQEILPLIGLLLALGVGGTVRAEQLAAVDPAAAAPSVTAAPAPEVAPTRIREEAQVAIGHDIALEAGKTAEAVVAVFGNASSAGEVLDSVVAVLGDTHVSGPVGDSVVSVLGNTHVDAKVNGNVVAVLGDVELGPRAEVGGDVVGVGGAVQRDPAAIVHGKSQSILPGAAQQLQGLHPWVRHCLLLGRPLAFAPGIGWAWTLALGFLALYVLLALLASPAVDRCAETLKSRPGQTLLVSILAVLLTPVLFVLLAITVIGLAVVPFLGLGLVAATLFGKAVVLAYLGRLMLRDLGRGEPWRTALAVVAGGAVMLLLYCIPVVGFIVFKLLGVLGLGVVMYTLFLNTRSRSDAAAAAAATTPAPEASMASAAAPIAAAVAAAPAEGPAAAPAAPAAPPIAVDSLPRAGFWLRMGALLIDVVLVGVVSSLLHRGEGGHLMLLLLAAYAAVMWKLRGTTIGGIVCNLQVARLDGRPLDWATSIVRALGCLLSMVAAGLGFFWIAFDPEKQAWHDKIAGTVVVRAPAGRSLV